jgi:outer membrane protein assembly factor BamB
MAQTPTTPPSNWWMYHGDPAHTGYVTGSNITSKNVGTSLKVLHQLQLRGSIMSVPAIVDGYAYVGTANSHAAAGGNGGSLNKINLKDGTITSYVWAIDPAERDSHGFTGMGCTPAVINGYVYFSAFDGCVYCLNQATMTLAWMTNLRHADLAHNQPANNTIGMTDNPPVSGWSSPVCANGNVYVGVGEGENPNAFGFVYCLDGKTGKVKWLFCTNKFTATADNAPNVVPSAIAIVPLPPGFTIIGASPGGSCPITMGSSVWSAIAYDSQLNRLYCSTGNPSPDGTLPTLGYTNGILALDATTGNFMGFTQFPVKGSYRANDADVDVGGAPTIFTLNGRKVVGAGCKNGTYMILDATTLEIIVWRQMLPYMNDGSQIPTVDPHGPDDPNNPNPVRTNEQSNSVANPPTGNNETENFYGTYSTAAVHPGLGKLFIGIGGNNYHYIAPGIDSDTTPFMRAMDWITLGDAWPMDNNDPQRYLKARPPMYTTAGESGLSVPAVVNDVVFMATSGVNLYAFSAVDGTSLWSDALGSQTLGANGGYGYCLGPAISGDYVVAGALINGLDGGVLKIYTLQS